MQATRRDWELPKISLHEHILLCRRENAFHASKALAQFTLFTTFIYT